MQEAQSPFGGDGLRVRWNLTVKLLYIIDLKTKKNLLQIAFENVLDSFAFL